MFNQIADMLTIPFTRDLSLKQMGLAFLLFIIIAILAFDIVATIKEGYNSLPIGD